MNTIITGNPTKGLAASLSKQFPDAAFFSRSNGYDLTTDAGREAVSDAASTCDVFINCSALWRFHQTLLLESVYRKCRERGTDTLIICVGSTTDRTTKGSDWLYQQEKKALRSYANSLNLQSTWQGGPRVSLISLGSLTNVQHKHPDRVCMDIDAAAAYIKWIADQPRHLVINEMSIDPRQRVGTDV